MKLARSAHGAIWERASRAASCDPAPSRSARSRADHSVQPRRDTTERCDKHCAAAGVKPRQGNSRGLQVADRRIDARDEDAEQPRTKLGHAEQTRALELDHRRPTGLAPTPAQSFHGIAPPVHEAETGPRVRSLDEGHKSNPRAATAAPRLLRLRSPIALALCCATAPNSCASRPRLRHLTIRSNL